MHRRIGSALIAAACALWSAPSSAVEFRYHGTLQDGGRTAEGAYDIELTLYSAAAGGHVLGGPLTLASVPVRGGSFDVQADFGPLSSSVDTAWLGARVRGAGDALFATLPGRSALTAATASVCPGAWTLAGNAGNPAGSYVGTADAQPLVLKADATAAMTLSAVLDSGSVIGINAVAGDPSNLITAGVIDALIGGGQNNQVDTGGNLAAVVGGSFNKATGVYSAIAGGYNNKTTATRTIVAGGTGNSADDANAAVVGGDSNSASATDAAVVGGALNSAQNTYAVAVGGSFNVAGGVASFAGGSAAVVRGAAQAGNAFGDYGTFAWSDSFGNGITSTGPNQFLVSANGGVAIDGTPLAGNVELTLHGTQAGSFGDDNVDLVMMPRGGNPGYDIVATSDGAFSVFRTNDFGTPRLGIDSNANLTIVGAHAYKATSGTWEASSDARIKDRIVPLTSALDTLSRLHPVSYHYGSAYRALHGDFEDRPYLGFVAQEYAQVFPFAVSSSGERVPGAPASEPPVLSLDIQPAFVTAVAATQELALESADLRTENRQLREQLALQRRRIDAQQASLDEALTRIDRLERARER